MASILPRVFVTYTSHAMAPFARDMSYDGPSFAWDCKDVMGADYPSEILRVFQNNQTKRFGGYPPTRLEPMPGNAAVQAQARR